MFDDDSTWIRRVFEICSGRINGDSTGAEFDVFRRLFDRYKYRRILTLFDRIIVEPETVEFSTKSSNLSRRIKKIRPLKNSTMIDGFSTE